MADCRVELCGADRAADVHRLTQVAFAPQAALDPPSGAVNETVERVADDLRAGGGALAIDGSEIVGCLRWQVSDDDRSFHVRRLAVDPLHQRRGVATALMAWAETEARARGVDAVSVGVRVALASNIAFYAKLGYEVVAENRHDGYDHTTWFSLRKPV